MAAESRERWVQWVLRGLAGIAFVAFGWLHAARVNVDPSRHDQDSYLAFAVRQHDSHFTALGSRRQMPLYPSLQALFYDGSLSPAQHFERAKHVNIVLSAILAIALAVGLRRLLPRREATNLALVAIFFVIAFRAPYVQAEVLVYAFMFVAFLAMCALWRRPTPLSALATGVATGLGFLTKGTALLGLEIFLLLYAAREIARFVRTRAPLVLAKNLAWGGVAAATFGAIVYPYIANSKRIYGSYFYDMSTRYVMWCDSWEQYCELNRKFGTHDMWLDHPPPEIPTMQSYLRTHGVLDVAKRTAEGLAEVVGNALLSHGYALFFVLLLVFGTALVLQHAEVRRAMFRPRDLDWVGWFVLPYLLLHLLVFGFYGPLGAGERFSLAMFLPAAYAMMRAISTHAGEHPVKVSGLEVSWRAFNVAFFVLVLVELVIYFPAAMATSYAGG